jgi:ribosomal protein L37AE/L43A
MNQGAVTVPNCFICERCKRQITLLVQSKGMPICSKCGRNMAKQDATKKGA